ncbi:MAG TPA: tail fiber protein [Solirubrobacteraceae bacterium]|jgi:microcystin-dependent protein
MAEPFLGEIRLMSFAVVPKGWALCNGQLMSIQQNSALFTLLGVAYGGDGKSNFALPNLQGSVPMHAGNGHGLGTRGGQEAVALTLQQMPSHSHLASAVNTSAAVSDPTNNFLAASNALYGPAPGNTTLAPSTVSSVGGSQPHENRQPFLTVSFAIALAGIYPSRN